MFLSFRILRSQCSALRRTVAHIWRDVPFPEVFVRIHGSYDTEDSPHLVSVHLANNSDASKTPEKTLLKIFIYFITNLLWYRGPEGNLRNIIDYVNPIGMIHCRRSPGESLREPVCEGSTISGWFSSTSKATSLRTSS